MKTIAALATATAPSGVAVIRISGNHSGQILRSLFRSKKSPVDYPREIIFGEFFSSQNEKLDEGLAFFMVGPKSYTGEDTVEIQFHGSPLIAEKLLQEIYHLGAFPAEPGEFTKRAYLNGKLDLLQAEGIADLINATSDHALKLAKEQLGGRLSDAINSIGEPLRDLLAEIEAQIDFPEEEISPDSYEAIKRKTAIAQVEIARLLQTYQYGQTVKEGFRILITGLPNAGKSSLLNALLGTKRAIVSNISGTTRDTIEETAVFSGYRFVLCDSAGIRETDNPIEKMGIELATEKIPWADLLMLVVDSSLDLAEAKKLYQQLGANNKPILTILNKSDLVKSPIEFPGEFQIVSTKSPEMIHQLKNVLIDKVKKLSSTSDSNTVAITNLRHKVALELASNYLINFQQALTPQTPIEIASLELRSALKTLQEIVGETHTEDILGRIFSKFCIGK